MASITRLPAGTWRAQVRRKGRYAASTFLRRRDAEVWSLEVERAVDLGNKIPQRRMKRSTTFADLVQLHIDDMKDVGQIIRRSKDAVLRSLVSDLGDRRLKDLTRDTFIAYGRTRAKQGAGPVTIAIDISYIKTVLTHAAAVHGVPVSPEEVALARAALKHLGLVGRGIERDRRLTQNELDRLIQYFESNPRQLIPMGRIIPFAVATALRQEEICAIDWSDVDLQRKTVLVRNRKDPRRKDGNHQRVPLLNLTGYDAWTLLLEQKIVTRGRGRVFPHNHKSIGTAFRRGCQALEIIDLHFHDLRHEATSRLFEAGLTIEKVALVTGHKDWRMLRRYTNLKPEDLLRLQKQHQPSFDEVCQLLIST